ncbi:MAG: SCO family protein [Polyangiales bacterium]
MESSVGSTAFRGWASSLLFSALALACASPKSTPKESASPSRVEPAPTALPYYSTADFTAEWLEPGSPRALGAHTIASFAFVDAYGHPVTREGLRGRIYVANFFFSSCPVVCPKMAATFRRIQDTYERDADVVLLSHTVDPDSDTPERLAAYAAKVGAIPGKWQLVTGDVAAIYDLARTSYFAEKQIGLKKGSNEFLHTENMLLVDRHGHLRGIYDATLPAEAARVIEDIATLKSEP